MGLDKSTGRVSLDIVDQSVYEPDKPVEPTGTSRLCMRFIVDCARSLPQRRYHRSHSQNDDSNQVENSPSRLSLLAVALKGCDLLNIGTVLVFGIWEVLLSGHDGLVVLTKVELGLLMISVLVYAFFILASGGSDQA